MGILWAGLVYGGTEESLKIISPVQEEVIQGDKVTVTWKLEREGKISHTHISLDDGKPRVTRKDSKIYTGLPPGKHTVKIWVADADHQPVPGLEASVVFFME
jgi:hypothetical protein